MVDTRSVATVDGEGNVSVEEEPLPAVGEGEVLVDVETSVITPGTQGGTVTARREDPDPSRDPYRLGYQNAGDVVEAGPGVDRFAPGDRIGCFGTGRALHADYAVVPVNLCVGLPDGVTYEEGSLFNIAATALHAVRRAELDIGENAVVVGLGLIGQVAGQLAGLSGCRVLGSDLLGFRTDVAATVGFDEAVRPDDGSIADVAEAFTDGYGMDCGFVCTADGGTVAFESALETMKLSPDGHRMGRIVVPGNPTITQEFAVPLGNVDIRNVMRTGPGYHDPAYERGADYPPVFVRWPTRRNLEVLVGLLADGDLDVESLLTDRYALDDAPAAFDRILDHPDEALGVVIEGE